MDPNSTSTSTTTIDEKLSQLSTAQTACTIYRVHRHLRNVNPTAYEPEVIAIGPYHRDKDHLKMMEDHKLRYFKKLLQRRHDHQVEKYVTAIGRLESEARKCYADQPINLTATEFTEMLVLDGCFIIELVLKFGELRLREKNDPIFQMNWMINSLQRDLMLFENQVPFFVLCELFDLIDFPNQHVRLSFFLLKFFSILYPGKAQLTHLDADDHFLYPVKHLLDLVHRSWIPPPLNEGRKKEKRLRFISSATSLREANVKFERTQRSNDQEEVTLFVIEFKEGVMFMEPLTIEDRTESFLRNLIAYEQYFQHNRPSFVTDYVKLMDCLIDSSKDVEILTRNGIVENWLGDDEVVAKMVNKLADSVAGPGDGFVYAEISEDVNKYCKKHRNRWMAKLRRNYLNSPWGVISILVAVVLLLLTVTQTLFTILQVVQCNKN